MPVLTLLGLATGLAMDATAVAVSCGMAIRGNRIKNALVVALWFGTFQAGMLLTGFYCGCAIRKCLLSIAHWVAFTILLVVGLRMIYHGVKNGQNITTDDISDGAPSHYTLFLLAIATSLDALAAGFSMSILYDISVFIPAVLIGGVTFLLSFTGHRMGVLLKTRVRFNAHIIGGIIITLISAHIFINNIKVLLDKIR
jgi:putative Mn2+ efflux pump MntP